MWHRRCECQRPWLLLDARRELFTYVAKIWRDKLELETIPRSWKKGAWDWNRKLLEFIFSKLYPNSLGKMPPTEHCCGCWKVERFSPGGRPKLYAAVILVNVVLSGICIQRALSRVEPEIPHEPQFRLETLVA